ncbi:MULTISPECIES: TIGR03749 family integrating conjugative element protein [unclassified Pantoea]|uniref:TIGR03749 family integrating conjugative element protein n=1 Tax=unclassified Pantoea TaxID=2630326 RepID=UPI001CD19E76|nr:MULTISPECIES: TIGR03749 family integrating conjugative element protein [unclassified Pantoea]MCA1179524.1 TIGR03749 family integrating conjugative element protein [Pantoea sp. alder69]MCA1251777.1 TIGR03749 family integrating conjugative element protein [Pantoea sp. alder70]MCA1267886.1 TIGR03749 family integrating conjugative element protein [Pantoea sp. alder81]
MTPSFTLSTRACLVALSLSLLLAVAMLASPAQADELMKWERVPLQIPLKTGQERVIFVDKNVRVGFPPALNGKLRVQSTGGAVYLKADSDFPQTRLQLQDMESGEVILLDVRTTAAASAEPVKIIYSGDVSTVSSAVGNTGEKSGRERSTPQTKRKKVSYKAPIPVLLTRYAAQNLYAPVRTVEAVPGIHPVNPHLPSRITTLYPSAPVTVSPVAGWGVAGRTVVALRIRNSSSQKVILDPRELQGQFDTATFQHRWLGAAGTPEDTTTVYLVTSGRPDDAFVREPSTVRKAASRPAQKVIRYEN